MIDMQEYEYIRVAHFKYKHSIRKISKDTGKCRETIRKIIKGFGPKYRMVKNREKPIMDKYTEIIKSWLVEDRQAHEKQRHTATRIYHRLVEEHGFKGSNSTVRQFVRELKERLNLSSKEVFIPSDPLKRKGIEVDWGEARIEIGGEITKVYMFCMRTKYSGKIFVKLYPTMLQECFFNGHIEGFAYYKGVFDEIIYDNLKTAVLKILKGKGRLEQNAFRAFRAYYCYEAIFCNPAKGSEKGGVELRP